MGFAHNPPPQTGVGIVGFIAKTIQMSYGSAINPSKAGVITLLKVPPCNLFGVGLLRSA